MNSPLSLLPTSHGSTVHSNSLATSRRHRRHSVALALLDFLLVKWNH